MSTFQVHSRKRDPLTTQQLNPEPPIPNVYIFIFSLFDNHLNPSTAELARINTKERKVRRVKKNKEIQAERAKRPTPSRDTDALIGNEKQNGKRKRRKRNEKLKSKGTHSRGRISGGDNEDQRDETSDAF